LKLLVEDGNQTAQVLYDLADDLAVSLATIQISASR
jgi:hypothetical protein